MSWIIELLESGEVEKAKTVLKDTKHSIETKRSNAKSGRIYI